MKSAIHMFMLITVILIILAVFSGCDSQIATLKASPSTLNFGETYIGEKVEKEVILKNRYGETITINNITLSTSTDFTLVSGFTTSFDLDKNTEHTVKIEYTPLTQGDHFTELIVEHSASIDAKRIDIKGEGLVCARILLSEKSYDFNKKLINKTHYHDFEITNQGSANLELSGLTISGTDASLFKCSSAPIVIVPGDKKAITLTFEPINIGNFSAILTINHNAINEDQTLLFNLYGEGVNLDPQITLSTAAPWNFGSVATTIPSVQICEIESTGKDPLTVVDIKLSKSAEFTIDSLKDSNGNGITLPQTLAVGVKIFLAIQFAPSADTSFSDTMTIEHDGTNELPNWDITLSGIGHIETTQSYKYTGGSQQWIVPAGITSICIEAWGAEGNINSGYSNNSGLGGKGGYVKGDYQVTPGTTIYIYVGGKQGYNGGAPGGAGTSNNGAPGGNGGGASDVRIGGDKLTDRIIVAGGAGGGGGNAYSNQNIGGKGGDGGYPNGFAGAIGNTPGHWAGRGGEGGTQTAGGAGGQGHTSYAIDGVLGNGGDGNPGDGTWGGGGGGGGGGYYGGGGGGGGYGGSGGGGGGGSSYTGDLRNTKTSNGTQSGDGEIIIHF